MSRILAFGLVLCITFSAGTAKTWSPAEYPNPSTHEGSQACGRGSVLGFVCDPEAYLTQESADVVEGHIKQIQSADYPYGSSGCVEKDPSYIPGFQVAVAILSSVVKDGREPVDEAVRRFGEELFDDWGVGQSECGNGVLLVLAIEDRQVYISIGPQIEKFASKSRLQEVIFGMRPQLKEGKYDEAVEQAVIDIGLILAGSDPDSHHKGFRWSDIPWIPVAFIGGFISLFAWGAHNGRKSKREAQNFLEKLQREQETARTTGKYPAETCPICFEDLEQIDSNLPSAPSFEDSEETGTSNQTDLKEAKQPLITRRRSREKAPDSEAGPSTSNKNDEEEIEAKNGKKKPLGLPCGHTFCFPCISEWLKTNTQCPICRQDANPGQPTQQNLSVQNRGRNRNMDLYDREMGFRMHRLHRRYPGYISQNMVDTAQRGGWVDFQSMRTQMTESHTRSGFQSSGHEGSSISFGGGHHSSGGGVGGSW